MINPWKQGRVAGVAMYPPLGAWMSRRKLASAAWVPPQWIRLALAGAHGYFYQFPRVTLLAGETQLLRVTVTEDFWQIATLGNGTSALAAVGGSFRLQIYEDELAYKHSKYGMNQKNAVSIASEPGLNMFPHFIAAGSPVNCRVQNLDGANPNTVDVCLFGYSGWWRGINERPE
jgi:hypothetical protein